MSYVLHPLRRSEVYYPDSDGKPIAENTLQALWIMTLFGNLDLLFISRDDVFVAMDNFWYPVEGKPKICQAPDVYVAIGRPKGHRGSYKQWEEGGIAPQVVFEVLSPGNRVKEMQRKFHFYQKYGVEEYYIINPDTHELDVWFRVDGHLQPQTVGEELVSPRLGIRFRVKLHEEITVAYPDQQPFLTFIELGEARKKAEEARKEAEERVAATEKQITAALERATAAAERAEAAEERLTESESRAIVAEDRAKALAAKLRELGIDPDNM